MFKKMLNFARPVMLVLVVAVLFSACKKDDAPVVTYNKRTITLLTPGSVVAGSAVVQEKSDGNASITINLNDGFRPSGTLKASIVSVNATTTPPTVLTFATLNSFSGSTGTTDPVKSASGSVLFSTLDTGITGYFIYVNQDGVTEPFVLGTF